MNEIALAITADDHRWAAYQMEVDAQRLTEAFDQRQRRVRPAAFEHGDIATADPDGFRQLPLRDVERGPRFATERGE